MLGFVGFFLNISYTCVFLHVGVNIETQAQQRPEVLDSQELELQAVMCYLKWVLGAERGCCGSAVVAVVQALSVPVLTPK